jgi:hypothetical protein
VDARIAQLRRQYPVAADDQDPFLDDGFHLFGIDPGSATKIKSSFSVSGRRWGFPARLAAFGRRLQAE